MSNKSNSTAIAQAFVRRAAELKYKGKARDRAAVEFTIGAALALHAAGVVDGGASMLGFLTATRGYSAVEDLARERPEESAEEKLCTCLAPWDKKPGKHHSLACPNKREV